jgi:hypothetical protein
MVQGLRVGVFINLEPIGPRCSPIIFQHAGDHKSHLQSTSSYGRGVAYCLSACLPACLPNPQQIVDGSKFASARFCTLSAALAPSMDKVDYVIHLPINAAAVADTCVHAGAWTIESYAKGALYPRGAIAAQVWQLAQFASAMHVTNALSKSQDNSMHSTH